MVEEGEEVPSFSLKNTEGKIITPVDFEGKKYVIYFYPKDFTPGCTTEAEEFSRDYNKFKEKGIEIIGISPDNIESHQKFGKKMNVPYILLSDDKGDAAKKFGVWKKKNYMGKEYFGVNRSTFLVNEKGEIFKKFEKVKPAGHSQEVLDYFSN